MTRKRAPVQRGRLPHAAILREASAFGASLAEFDRMADGLDVAGLLRTKAFLGGQSAIGRLVGTYVKAVPMKAYFADGRLFGREGDSPLLPTLGDRLWSISAAALGGRRAGRLDIDGALRLAFGADRASQLFGTALGGRFPALPRDGGPPFPEFPEIPGADRIPFEELNQIACYAGLRSALLELARVASAIGRTVPYPGMTIRELRPRTGCPGDEIDVIGSGFGARQPTDAVVVFGSTRADVVPGSWAKGQGKQFSVRAPKDVGECCVSILKVPPPTAGGTGTLASAASDLAGVVSECFGTAGIAAGSRLAGLANRLPDSEEAVCAPDGSNRFIGGRPRIGYFRTNLGDASPHRVLPGQALDLQWSIANSNSASITITPRPGTSPLAVVPSLPSWFVPNPTAGRTVVATTPGLVPWKVDVTLRATNACGSVSERIEVEWNPAPGVVFVGGGMRSSFDVGVIEALGAVLPVGPAVCAGSGLGALSAACTAADYPNPASLRAFWDGSVDGTSWYAPSAALQTPGRDFAAITTAEWQVRARAEILTMDALGLLRAFMVPFKSNDDRQLEMIITTVAGHAADKAMNALAAAVSTALQESGQAVLGSVPIVAIIWAAAKFAIATYNDAMKQQTANLLASLPSPFDDAGLRNLIATATAGTDQRIRASGRRVRIPLASLERGRALYGVEGAAISEAPIGSQIRANTTMTQVVQASACVPLLAAPTQIGTDSCVDGSLRDPVPIGATVEAGAGTVIVVQPHVRLVAEQASFTTAGVPRIDARTAVLRDAQLLDAALNPFGRFARHPTTGAPIGNWRAPVYVIEPTVDLVGLGASVGQSGLTNIMIDYGYMRAYDALAPWLLFPRDAQRADRDAMLAELARSSDRIIGLRVQSWELEHQLHGMRATPFGPTNKIGGGPLVADPEQSAIAAIRSTRLETRRELGDRLAIPGRYEARAGVPPGSIAAPPVPRPRAESWVQHWEKYNFDPLVWPTPPLPGDPNGDPWVSLGYAGLWTEPAGARPALLWP